MSPASGDQIPADSQFQQLIAGLPQLVWTCGTDGAADFRNQRWLDYTGLPAPDHRGHGWLNCVHPQDRPHVPAFWQRAVETGAQYAFEYRLRRHDGAYRWFDVQALPLRAVNGTITRWIGTNTDIEDRQELLQSLRESEARFRLLVDNAPDAFLVYDQSGESVTSTLLPVPAWAMRGKRCCQCG